MSGDTFCPFLMRIAQKKPGCLDRFSGVLQIAEAILKKNLNYMENEIKNLKSVDYTTFNDAEKWLKNAKVKLDNF